MVNDPRESALQDWSQRGLVDLQIESNRKRYRSGQSLLIERHSIAYYINMPITPYPPFHPCSVMSLVPIPFDISFPLSYFFSGLKQSLGMQQMMLFAPAQCPGTRRPLGQEFPFVVSTHDPCLSKSKSTGTVQAARLRRLKLGETSP